MKAILSIGLAALLSGCLLDVLMTTAVTGEMAAQEATATVEAMQDAQVDTDHIRLQQAVQLYQAETGQYPRELHELVPNFIEALPTLPDGKPFDYNPLTGTVLKSSGGPAPADYVRMEELRLTINAFGTQTGYYPGKLDDLYPHFITVRPRTASGKEFQYNNQNGEIRHPDEGAQYAAHTPEAAPPAGPVAPVNAIGSLRKGDLKDSNSLNKALDRIGY